MTPDKGAKRRTGISGLNKKRINSFEVLPFSSKIAFKGRVVGAVDDLIGTGGTLLRFCEFAKDSGAEKIVALATHGVLDAGVKKIKKVLQNYIWPTPLTEKKPISMLAI